MGSVEHGGVFIQQMCSEYRVPLEQDEVCKHATVDMRTVGPLQAGYSLSTSADLRTKVESLYSTCVKNSRLT